MLGLEPAEAGAAKVNDAISLFLVERPVAANGQPTLAVPVAYVGRRTLDSAQR